MNPTRTVLATGATLALLVAPPVVLSRWKWPVGADMTWDYVWLSLISGTLPTSVVHALVLVILWGLWGAFVVLVGTDVVAVLRGQIPRIGLLRLVATGAAGTSAAMSVTPVAVVSADTAPTTDEHTTDTQEPAHTLERTRVLAGFGFDSAELTPRMRDELLPTVELLQLFGDPGNPIAITGHTDSIGLDAYNRDLSQRRADAVAAFLTEQLGDGWTITSEGLGSDQPREQPDLGHAAERRGEITYTLTTRTHESAVPEEGEAETVEDPQSVEPAADEEPKTDPQADGGFRGGELIAEAVAGGAAGVIAGRLTAPGRRERKPKKKERDEAENVDLPEGEELDGDEALGSSVPVTRDADGGVISAEGHVRIADSLSVSARAGLGIAGAHAVGVGASLIARAVASPGTRVITSRQVMAEAGAPPNARVPGVTVSADTAAAITEAELASISVAPREQGEERILLLLGAPEHALVRDRLLTLAQADDDEVLVVTLGEGTGCTEAVCDSFDEVSVTASDGGTATYTDLRLLHIDQATFAAHFIGEGQAPEPPWPEQVGLEVSEEQETTPEPDLDEGQATPGSVPRTKVEIRLFAPHPHISVAGTDIGQRMRSSSRRMLAYLALHPRGVGTETLTEALFPDSTESKARALRNTASSDIRRVVRDALGDPEAEILQVDSGRYRIRQEVVDVDAWRFDAAMKEVGGATDAGAREEHLRSASGEYAQVLLSEVDLPWIEEKRQAYRRAAADCFVSLAKVAETGEQALSWLERARESDDLNEAVYQEIMKVHAALGRPDAVQRTFQDLSERLKAMRARPSAATNKLLNTLTTDVALSE
ncbi:OmpA family protein [Nocardiopsis sp. FIRDI 009]|uniref:OmpA family protein n=1 Tax=Nocardiopsis sp. FIRDI 009 TaxID=714197 RepID=UPI001E5D13FB|nr:OmpA family protein [Nocardiopsis sp. FIRDI 009]